MTRHGSLSTRGVFAPKLLPVILYGTRWQQVCCYQRTGPTRNATVLPPTTQPVAICVNDSDPRRERKCSRRSHEEAKRVLLASQPWRSSDSTGEHL